MAPIGFRSAGFGSPESPGDDAGESGESGETIGSGSGLPTSLVPYSGVGRRGADSGETVEDGVGLSHAGAETCASCLFTSGSSRLPRFLPLPSFSLIRDTACPMLVSSLGAVGSPSTGRMFRPGNPPFKVRGGARDVAAGSNAWGLLRGGSGNGSENKLLGSWVVLWADAAVEPWLETSLRSGTAKLLSAAFSDRRLQSCSCCGEPFRNGDPTFVAVDGCAVWVGEAVGVWGLEMLRWLSFRGGSGGSSSCARSA